MQVYLFYLMRDKNDIIFDSEYFNKLVAYKEEIHRTKNIIYTLYGYTTSKTIAKRFRKEYRMDRFMENTQHFTKNEFEKFETTYQLCRLDKFLIQTRWGDYKEILSNTNEYDKCEYYLAEVFQSMLADVVFPFRYVTKELFNEKYHMALDNFLFDEIIDFTFDLEGCSLIPFDFDKYSIYLYNISKIIK